MAFVNITPHALSSMQWMSTGSTANTTNSRFEIAFRCFIFMRNYYCLIKPISGCLYPLAIRHIQYIHICICVHEQYVGTPTYLNAPVCAFPAIIVGAIVLSSVAVRPSLPSVRFSAGFGVMSSIIAFCLWSLPAVAHPPTADAVVIAAAPAAASAAAVAADALNWLANWVTTCPPPKASTRLVCCGQVFGLINVFTPKTTQVRGFKTLPRQVGQSSKLIESNQI